MSSTSVLQERGMSKGNGRRSGIGGTGGSGVWTCVVSCSCCSIGVSAGGFCRSSVGTYLMCPALPQRRLFSAAVIFFLVNGSVTSVC